MPEPTKTEKTAKPAVAEESLLEQATTISVEQAEQLIAEASERVQRNGWVLPPSSSVN